MCCHADISDSGDWLVVNSMVCSEREKEELWWALTFYITFGQPPSGSYLFTDQTLSNMLFWHCKMLYICHSDQSILVFIRSFSHQADDGPLCQHVSAADPRPKDPQPSSEFHGVSLFRFPAKVTCSTQSDSHSSVTISHILFSELFSLAQAWARY